MVALFMAFKLRGRVESTADIFLRFSFVGYDSLVMRKPRVPFKYYYLLSITALPGICLCKFLSGTYKFY